MKEVIKKFSMDLLKMSFGAMSVIALHEGFTPGPVIPLKGDVPTIGHGTTVYPNGKHVTMHDKPITRKTADTYLRHHVSKVEKDLKHSIPKVKLSQVEYDVYVDFIYQYGIGTFNKSWMRHYLIKGKHTQACKSLLKYRFVAGRDCKIKRNRCSGVYTRQLNRYNKCMRAQ